MGKDTDFDPINDPSISGYTSPDFATRDPPTFACEGLVECIVCHKIHGYCNELSNTSPQNAEGEDEQMINRSQSSTSTNNQQGGGGSQRGQRQRNGLPFLSAKEASHTPQPGIIIAARVEQDTFNAGRQVVAMRIQFKDRHFLYNLRPNNPNLDLLCDAFGEDETTWSKKRIMISNEEDNFNGKVWLRLEAAEQEEEEPEPEPVAPKKGGRK